jgi:cellobiose transport system substrate-binding protein
MRALSAVLLATALAATACGDDKPATSASPGNITLTVSTFGTFGYETDQAGLFDEYGPASEHQDRSSAHRRRRPVPRGVADPLAANSGLADVVAVEKSHIGRIMRLRTSSTT